MTNYGRESHTRKFEASEAAHAQAAAHYRLRRVLEEVYPHGTRVVYAPVGECEVMAYEVPLEGRLILRPVKPDELRPVWKKAFDQQGHLVAHVDMIEPVRTEEG